MIHSVVHNAGGHPADPHVSSVTFEGGVNDPRVLSSDPIIDPSVVGLDEVEGSIYLDPTATRKYFSGTDYGAFAKPALLTIADGDVVTWALKNLDTAGNMVVRTVNMMLSRE